MVSRCRKVILVTTSLIELASGVLGSDTQVSEFVPGPDWLKYGILGAAALVACFLLVRMPSGPRGFIVAAVLGVLLTALAIVLTYKENTSTSTEEANEKVREALRQVESCSADLRTIDELMQAKGRTIDNKEAAMAMVDQIRGIVERAACKPT